MDMEEYYQIGWCFISLWKVLENFYPEIILGEKLDLKIIFECVSAYIWRFFIFHVVIWINVHDDGV